MRRNSYRTYGGTSCIVAKANGNSSWLVTAGGGCSRTVGHADSAVPLPLVQRRTRSGGWWWAGAMDYTWWAGATEVSRRRPRTIHVRLSTPGHYADLQVADTDFFSAAAVATATPIFPVHLCAPQIKRHSGEPLPTMWHGRAHAPARSHHPAGERRERGDQRRRRRGRRTW